MNPKSSNKASALLIIDMLNTFQFAAGRKLLARAKPAARAILRLKLKARKRKIPVIYINDNFGLWHSDWKEIYEKCRHSPGAEILDLLHPAREDFVILKPKHSIFYASPLEILLQKLGTKTLIFTGVALDQCVLFSIYDAYVREYSITIAKDAVASNTPALEKHTFAVIQKAFDPRIVTSRKLMLN